MARPVVLSWWWWWCDADSYCHCVVIVNDVVRSILLDSVEAA